MAVFILQNDARFNYEENFSMFLEMFEFLEFSKKNHFPSSSKKRIHKCQNRMKTEMKL